MNSKIIRKELGKLVERRKKLQGEIDCLSYELKTVEEAMVPLKGAYDALTKLDKDEPEKKATARKYEPRAQTCRNCDDVFMKAHPRNIICPDCKAALAT